MVFDNSIISFPMLSCFCEKKEIFQLYIILYCIGGYIMQPVYKIFGEHNNHSRKDFSQFSSDDYVNEVMNAKLAPPEGLAAPLSIMWELTSKCKNRCIYCYNSSSPDRSEQLSPKRMFSLANEIIQMKPFHICLTGGEPTENPYYLDMLTLLTSYGMKVSTILSGANLNDKYINTIASCVDTLQVSLDGSCAEIHDKVRGRKGSFDEVMYAIKKFVAKGVDVRASFASTRLNIDDFENTYNLCKELGITSLRTQSLARVGRAKCENGFSFYPSEEQVSRLESFLHKNAKAKNPMVEYAEPYLHLTTGMDVGITTLARITSSGDIGISPYLEAYFGNVNDEPFQDIWNRMKKGWHNPQMYEIAKKVAMDLDKMASPLDEKVYIK